MIKKMKFGKSSSLLVVLFLGIIGCSGSTEDMNAKVMYNHQKADLLAVVGPLSRYTAAYILCEKGQVVVVLTDRTDGIRIIDTVSLPKDQATCHNNQD